MYADEVDKTLKTRDSKIDSKKRKRWQYRTIAL